MTINEQDEKYKQNKKIIYYYQYKIYLWSSTSVILGVGLISVILGVGLTWSQFGSERIAPFLRSAVGTSRDEESGAEEEIGGRLGSVLGSVLESRGSTVLSAMHIVTYFLQALKIAAKMGQYG